VTARNILIIGAGIGGLTTALAFARNGDDVDIVEQAPSLSEVGAGLQVSPNASRILIALGLGDKLRQAMITPHEIVLASGRSLRKITHVPCGAFAADRWEAPYGVMHRADLQAMLLEAVLLTPVAVCISVNAPRRPKSPGCLTGWDCPALTLSSAPTASGPRFADWFPALPRHGSQVRSPGVSR